MDSNDKNVLKARLLLGLIAVLNILNAYFTGSVVGGQIVLGILLIKGNDIVRWLFVFASIIGIILAFCFRYSSVTSVYKIDFYFIFFIIFCLFTFLILTLSKNISNYIKMNDIKKKSKKSKR